MKIPWGFRLLKVSHINESEINVLSLRNIENKSCNSDINTGSKILERKGKTKKIIFFFLTKK